MNRDINFSVWLDFIERDYLQNGEFQKLIDNGIINGATSNPAIFEKAFSTSSAYKNDIERMKKEGLSSKEIYENLAVEDIKIGAEKLKPLCETGNMGFVSIEVDPFFADDVKKTVEEGVRLYEKIGMKNVMIKIPATEAGYGAMEELFSRDIPVNATLIFTLDEAIKSAEAMKRGLIRSKNKTASGVLSVFVSRLDVATNSVHFGIANSSYIYREIEKRQYPNVTTLFASTGVKNPDLPEDYYIRGLIGKNSINTAPLKTIEAYVKNGSGGDEVLPLDEKQESEILNSIKNSDEILENLKSAGLKAFEESFSKTLKMFE
ncbi:transaldolase [Thiovulum sp. ES]|nr:transaldolase [Thiovulum sp. ES]